MRLTDLAKIAAKREKRIWKWIRGFYANEEETNPTFLLARELFAMMSPIYWRSFLTLPLANTWCRVPCVTREKVTFWADADAEMAKTVCIFQLKCCRGKTLGIVDWRSRSRQSDFWEFWSWVAREFRRVGKRRPEGKYWK